MWISLLPRDDCLNESIARTVIVAGPLQAGLFDNCPCVRLVRPKEYNLSARLQNSAKLPEHTDDLVVGEMLHYAQAVHAVELGFRIRQWEDIGRNICRRNPELFTQFLIHLSAVTTGMQQTGAAG